MEPQNHLFSRSVREHEPRNHGWTQLIVLVPLDFGNHETVFWPNM